MKLRLKSTTMLVQLFISYILIIIVSLSIMGVVSDKSLLLYAEKELSLSFIKNLEVSDQIFRMWSQSTQKQALNLATNPNMQLFNSCPDFNNIMKERISYYLAEGLFGELNTAISLNDHYSSIAIFPTDANYIVSSGGGIKLKTEYTDTSWISEHSTIDHTITPLARPYGVDHIISFIYPLALYQTPVKGSIVLNIKESALSTLINGGSAIHDGSVFIMNTGGDMISNPDRKLLGQNFSGEPWFMQILNSGKTSGSLKPGNNPDHNLITYYKSNVNDLIYVSEYSLTHLNELVREQRTLITHVVLLVAVIGILASYMISRFLYSPIRLLTNKMKDYGKKTIIKNELLFLSDAFEDIMEQVEKGKADSFENDLLKLINGTSGKEQTQLMSRFHPGYFCCALIRLDQAHNANLESGDKELNEYFGYISDSMNQVFHDFYFCKNIRLNRQSSVIILNFGTLCNDRLIPAIRNIQDDFYLTFNSSFSVGIGGTQESSGELYKSYKQAGLALQKRLLLGYNCAVEYQEEYITPNMYFFPLELENMIENNLLVCNYSKIEDSLRSLADGFRHDDNISTDNIFQIFNQIIGVATKHLIENHINTQMIFANRSNLYQELGQCETLDELLTFTLDVFRRITDYLTLNSSNKNERVEYICNYIQEHYGSDISLTDLAEQAGISVSYMRRIFSEETGTNILYYINSLRISKAKELLQSSNLSISDIASKVGYFNNQSFNRFFKKYEGITPSEYRNSQKK